MATIGGLLMPDMYEAFQGGLKDGQSQLAHRTLAQYAQPALGGDQSALAKIYSADPATGLKVQNAAQDQQAQAAKAQDEGMARIGKYARMVSTMAEAGDMQGAAGLYKTIYPEAAKVLGPNLPPDLDPSMLPHMKQLADAMDPTAKKDLINVGAGGTVFDPSTRQPIFQNPGVPKAPGIVSVDLPDNTTQQFENTPNGLVPLKLAPNSQQAPQDAMTQILARANAMGQSGIPDDQVQQYILQQAQQSGVQMTPEPGQMGTPAAGVSPLPANLTPQATPAMQLGRSAPKRPG